MFAAPIVDYILYGKEDAVKVSVIVTSQVETLEQL